MPCIIFGQCNDEAYTFCNGLLKSCQGSSISDVIFESVSVGHLISSPPPFQRLVDIRIIHSASFFMLPFYARLQSHYAHTQSHLFLIMRFSTSIASVLFAAVPMAMARTVMIGDSMFAGGSKVNNWLQVRPMNRNCLTNVFLACAYQNGW
jgi:hypothetical protein